MIDHSAAYRRHQAPVKWLAAGLVRRVHTQRCMCRRAALVLAILSFLHATACLEEPVVEPQDKLSSNGLVLDHATLRELSPAPLSGQQVLLATEDGRELLGYAATCALDEGETLTMVSGDTEYHFDGAIGLAPQWHTEACDLSCQRWISACLLAHANSLGVSVEIAMRGNHPALAREGNQGSAFQVQEAGYYGNVFGATDAEQPQIFVCGGRNLFRDLGFPSAGIGLTALVESIAELFHNRLCALEGECGIQISGLCWQPPDLGPVRVCADDAGDRGAYGGCYAHVPAAGESQTAIDEVITVYVQE